jgi:hypothetical protein
MEGWKLNNKQINDIMWYTMIRAMENRVVKENRELRSLRLGNSRIDEQGRPH